MLDLAVVAGLILQRMLDQAPRAATNELIRTLSDRLRRVSQGDARISEAVDRFLAGESTQGQESIVYELLAGVLAQNSTLAGQVADLARRAGVNVNMEGVSARDISISIANGLSGPPLATPVLYVADEPVEAAPGSPSLVPAELVNPTLIPLAATLSVVDLSKGRDSTDRPLVAAPESIRVLPRGQTPVALLVDPQPGHSPGERRLKIHTNADGILVAPADLRVRVMERPMCEVEVWSKGKRAIAETTNTGNVRVSVNADLRVYATGQTSQAAARTVGHATLDPGQAATIAVAVPQLRLFPRTVDIAARVDGERIPAKTIASRASISPMVPPLLSALTAFILLIFLLRWTGLIGSGLDSDRPHHSTASKGSASPSTTEAARLDQPAMPAGFAFTVRPIQTEGSCVGHATDEVRALLHQVGCDELQRFVAVTSVSDRKVLVSGARFYVGTEAQRVVDRLNTADTGDMNSLLAEKRYPGLPYGFDGDSPYFATLSQQPGGDGYVVAVKAMWSRGDTVAGDRATLLPICRQIAAIL